MNNVGYYESPIGWLKITASDKAIHEVLFANEKQDEHRNPIIEQCIKELEEYFQNQRTDFSVPLEFTCGTTFQQNCWKALMTIPYGKTCSYQEIAEKVGSPKAVRAVGGANHNNPICIIVPCHRVIGKRGSLVGYGGGIDKKITLLKLEGSLQ